LDKGTAQKPSLAKVAVLGALTCAIAFGGYLGYLAWTNGSFPSQQKPFGDYASVASASFNGTEYAFTITWLSADYLPLKAQITSSASEIANSPVCWLGLTSVTPGQSIFMPFGVSSPSTSLTGVDLSIDVKSLATGAEFTIALHVDSVVAQPGDITPSEFVCSQPSSQM
jgi:hypothetical protein